MGNDPFVDFPAWWALLALALHTTPPTLHVPSHLGVCLLVSCVLRRVSCVHATLPNPYWSRAFASNHNPLADTRQYIFSPVQVNDPFASLRRIACGFMCSLTRVIKLSGRLARLSLLAPENTNFLVGKNNVALLTGHSKSFSDHIGWTGTKVAKRKTRNNIFVCPLSTDSESGTYKSWPAKNQV